MSYLKLLYDEDIATECAARLGGAPVRGFAKDLFRASRLGLFGISNAHVERDQRKIEAGKAFSPLLLVRDTVHARVITADGYPPRSRDLDELVCCKLVWPHMRTAGKEPPGRFAVARLN